MAVGLALASQGTGGSGLLQLPSSCRQGASLSSSRKILGPFSMGPAYNRQGTSPEECLLNLGVGKREDTGWLKLYPEAVGRVISLDCCLDWILAPLLMWPLVQKRC